ncbi:MAG: hypothetical protein QNK04_10900 [Myxococcota bacterium]|nr:hypothetical protein [Myxococcota bacterium]
MRAGLPLLIVSVFVAAARAEPETRAPANPRGAQTSLLAEHHYSIAGVRVGRANLDRIVSSLGPAKTLAGAHLTRWVCYVGDSGTRVVFENNAVGYGYAVYSATEDPEPTLECTTSSAVTAQAANGFGLRLGLTRAEVVELLGTPTRLRDDEASYFYRLQVAVSPEERESKRLPEVAAWRDVSSGIGLRFSNGRVTYYSVFTTETY